MTNPSPVARVNFPWKRSIDVLIASIVFIVTLPVILLAMTAVFLGDFRYPFFISDRIGRNGTPFRFLKIRTMVPDAYLNGVNTTIAGDARITPVGRLIRALKIDELPQLLHVIHGTMSLVGPRPNVAREVSLYTREELRLLSVLPGITDYSSIVFSDLSEILANSSDANLAYNQLVRPWKSRLGLHYISNVTLTGDLRLLMYTVAVLFARGWTLQRLCRQLRRTGAPDDLCKVSARQSPLRPTPPPGATNVVTLAEMTRRSSGETA